MLETTLSKLRKNLQQEVNRCIEHHEVLYVKQREGENFVILGAQDWQAIEATIFLNQIPNMVSSIHAAAAESLDNGTHLEDLDW